MYQVEAMLEVLENTMEMMHGNPGSSVFERISGSGAMGCHTKIYVLRGTILLVGQSTTVI